MQRTEHHAGALCGINDAVFSMDSHPTQLDVLRVCRAHPRVLLDKQEEVELLQSKVLSTAQRVTVVVQYLKVVDEQLVEGRVGI